MPRQCVAPGEDCPHSVYRYTDQIYKVIPFYSVYPHRGPGPVESQKHHDKKLDSSISRTKRVILEKALCNPWEWFCTFTIAKDKFDRKDLITWRDTFTQWMRDQRKKGLPDIDFSKIFEGQTDAIEALNQIGTQLAKPALYRPRISRFPIYRKSIILFVIGMVGMISHSAIRMIPGRTIIWMMKKVIFPSRWIKSWKP